MKNKFKLVLLLLLRRLFNDKLYYQVRYFIKNRKSLNLKSPDTFNAKLNWLKLYDRDPLYTKLVDKYAVREYVENRIGSEYLNDIYGIYKSTNEIVFDELPDSFVLKGTHGSGWILICKNKSLFDIKNAKKTMQGWLNKNFYEMWGEWVYNDVPPRIICEKFLSQDNESSLIDYKFYCFHGKPEFLHVDLDRSGKTTKNFYDLNWNLLPFSYKYYPQSMREIEKPSQLNKMIELATILSKEFKFVRVDFYNLNNKIIFGELTFYPTNGLKEFTPDKYNFEIGKYINI